MTDTQKKVWSVLAIMIVAAALLELPYTLSFLEHSSWAHTPRARALTWFNAFGTVVVGWTLAAVGLALAARLGLGAPLIAARVEKRPVEIRKTLGPPLAWGLLTGALLLGLSVFLEAPMERFMPKDVHLPWWAGVLASFSAGVNEEAMLRLFLLSAIALPLTRLFPRPAALWSANVVAALAFGALHFGNVRLLGMELNPVLATFILVVNGGVGLLCGWLFWTRGIEAAMTCHTAIDLVLHGLGAVLAGGGRA